jgi:hypothetical protein
MVVLGDIDGLGMTRPEGVPIVWLEERARSTGQRTRESDLFRRIERTHWVTEMTAEEQDLLRRSGRP